MGTLGCSLVSLVVNPPLSATICLSIYAHAANIDSFSILYQIFDMFLEKACVR